MGCTQGSRLGVRNLGKVLWGTGSNMDFVKIRRVQGPSPT